MNLINLVIIVITILEMILFIFYLLNSDVKQNDKRLLIISMLIIIISIIINLKNVSIEFLTNKQIFLLFIIIQSTIILCLMYKIVDVQKKYNKIINYVIEYEKIIDDQGKKNHEYNNQLLVLKGYIDNKKKLKEYLDTIVEDHRTGQSFEIRQLHHFPNGGIKELLYCKLARMKENNIKFYIYVTDEVKDYFEKFNIKMYRDITKIFGVFIDNAIDAAINSEKKEVELDFKKDDNYLIIKISNTFKDDEELSKIGSKGYTSKGKGHGYGLSIVRDIIKTNKKIEVSSDINKEMYEQTILIEI